MSSRWRCALAGPRRECGAPSRRSASRLPSCTRARVRSAVVTTPSATVSLSVRASSSVAPLADLEPERAIAAERARARQHEIAEPGESGERRWLRAERDAEPRHLGQPARDERRARVEAEPEAFDDSGRDGHHVLERAAKLDADDVVVRVDAKVRRAERALRDLGRVGIARTRRRSPSAAARRLRRRSSARRARRRMLRDLLRRDVRHQRERLALDALGRDARSALTSRTQCARRL